MSTLSGKALLRLSDDLGQLINRYEAMRKQILTLHMQGKGTAQSAYFVGVAQTLARSIQQDLDNLSNAIYNLALQQEKDEHARATPANGATPTSPPRQEAPEGAQADARPRLETA